MNVKSAVEGLDKPATDTWYVHVYPSTAQSSAMAVFRAQHLWVVCGVSCVQHVHQHCSVSVLASRNKEEPETGTGCGPETHLGHSLISAWGHTSPLPQQIRDCTGLERIFFTAACLVLYFRFATKTILITQ